ncbi:hypothetical protein HYC85_027682 [Camellia sinensis]|uniref:Retrotransposon gag domain-containing protein n=1 Tax=Camellia sinensis TaxID=4442 RepID=A0A7J7FU20_CAMSI|nr:hypothetical protein HYC85_027682 [Camellia sinensis]
MGLTRPQKLSLFGPTMLGIPAIWYAKLEDSVKQNWEEIAEAFIVQYSYNTQIEVITRDLEAICQESKEDFSEFVMRWRAKASMMTTRPSEKDHRRMIAQNLHGKLVQKMIVLPLVTFTELHEMGVQIEDDIRQGIIVKDNEPLKKNVVHSSNATTSGSRVVKCSEVNTVTTPINTQKPTTSTRPQARNFHPLYMSLSQALKMLLEKGYLELLEP